MSGAHQHATIYDDGDARAAAIERKARAIKGLGQNSGDPIRVTTVPLAEATAEIRFPGDARVEAWRGELQQQVRKDFPLLFVPFAKEGEAPALQHYRFQCEDSSMTLSLAVNSLAFSTRVYPGWAAFRARILGYWSLLNGAISPRRLTRIGLRYKNLFLGDLKRDLTGGDRRYLAVLRDRPIFHRAVTVLDCGECQLIVNVGLPEETEAPIEIDLDAFVRDVHPDALELAIEQLHETLESEFLAIISNTLASELHP
jgi:uncharacterized protein (TIGR04255 family)